MKKPIYFFTIVLCLLPGLSIAQGNFHARVCLPDTLSEHISNLNIHLEGRDRAYLVEPPLENDQSRWNIVPGANFTISQKSRTVVNYIENNPIIVPINDKKDLEHLQKLYSLNNETFGDNIMLIENESEIERLKSIKRRAIQSNNDVACN